MTPFQVVLVVASETLVCMQAYMCMCLCVLCESIYVLFSTVHPLNVLLVVCFELLALQFECIRDQASLWCPGLRTQSNLLGYLESLQFCWLGEEGRTQARVTDSVGKLQQSLAQGRRYCRAKLKM